MPDVEAKKNEVREIHTNDREMKVIRLAMGRSTVLSFTERPIKVVAGNSNYFNVEFVGNDVTLQPLANVESNMFIYTQSKSKFGFHLKVGSVSRYDDLVYVRFKGDTPISNHGAPLMSNRKKLEPFFLAIGNLQVFATNLFQLGSTKTFVLDFILKNKEDKILKLREVQVFVSKNKERIKGQTVVFEKDSILMHDQSRGRIFFSADKMNGITFYVSYKKKLKGKNLSKRYH
jgi:hypothetical protein